MRQIRITTYGGPEVLAVEEAPIPKPGLQEVLIKVRTAGINRPDCLQRAGLYPPPPGVSEIPGLEVAGIVEQVGEGVVEWRKGDAVCALLSGGGYAEYALASATLCLPVPRGFTFEEAAALPEVLFTTYDNLVTRAGLRKGETLLVHGGSGGIGSMAIRLGKILGATVYASAGNPQKAAYCARLGADETILYREDDFFERVKVLTHDMGVDVILDMVGAAYLKQNLESLRLEGRLVIIATQKGAKAEIDLRQIMNKRITVTGSTLRPRSLSQKAAIAAKLREHIWPLVEDLKLPLHAVFPLEEASKAHALMESGGHCGKIVLTAMRADRPVL